MKKYDFSGWVTRNDLKCSDGRTIRRDAFKHNDGHVVPLVWNHQHNDSENVLGKVLLQNRDEGVYGLGFFNDTERAQNVKMMVAHGDIVAMSIWANQLTQKGGDVMHGDIKEVSLVLAGANPGAYIDCPIAHSEDVEDGEATIYTGEEISLYHSAKDDKEEEEEKKSEDEKKESEDKKNIPEKKEDKESVIDIINTMSEKQQNAMYILISELMAEKEEKKEEKLKHSDKGGYETMKYNVFDNKENNDVDVLSHSAQVEILNIAKSSSVGSLKTAMAIYADEHNNELKHGIDDIEKLFPDFKDVHPGAPELLERDQSWIGTMMNKVRKSPISRIRTRQADARAEEIRAKGYNNRTDKKTVSKNLKLIMRTTDPQTVYRRDELHRDDITDITDFDVVAYQKTVMRHNLEEDVALAALIGDGREDTDKDKIHENHIRSVWNDDELYTIHYDVDISAMEKKLQGTNTNANFGEEYIYAEAVVAAALYSREQYKGKGTPDFYCDPHVLNVMLLARDMNGRRIYDSKSDLAKALNVGSIETVEQMAGKTSTTDTGDTKKLLGIFVHMGNYQFGCTKGGEITNFDDFDIDFNKYKYLMETRLSGALTEIKSAIALEIPVAKAAADHEITE